MAIIEQLRQGRTRVGAGMEVVLVVFLLLAIGMLSISWFQANVVGGEAVEDELIRQSEFDDADITLQNTLTYLQEAFFTSGERGTDEAASMAGRYQEEPVYRYWMCKNEPQPATLEEARNASGTFVMADFNNRINEVHGIRNNYVHKIGALQCTEVGYYDPRDTPQNDHFKSAYQIEDASVHREDEDISREVENVTQKRDILFNRNWYMYEILKYWVENEDMKNKVREEVREQVPDTKALQNRMCLTNPETECVYPEPYSCFYKHQSWLDAAVTDGLTEEMRKLETAPQYFNNTGVSCHVEFNDWREQDPEPGQPNISFPGHRVEPRVNYAWEDTGVCCDDKYHGDGPEPEDGDSDGCEATYHNCITSWYLAFESYLDFTVVCEDEKFNTVPTEDELEHFSWEIDLSYTVQEEEPGEEYDVPGTNTECIRRARPPVSYLPLTLNPCSFEDEELDTCKVPVETVGELEVE